MSRTSITQLNIIGASCVGKIETAIKAVNGVKSAEMNFADRTVLVNSSLHGLADAIAVSKAVEICNHSLYLKQRSL